MCFAATGFVALRGGLVPKTVVVTTAVMQATRKQPRHVRLNIIPTSSCFEPQDANPQIVPMYFGMGCLPAPIPPGPKDRGLFNTLLLALPVFPISLE